MRWKLDSAGYAEIVLESWDEINKFCELCGCKNIFELSDKVRGEKRDRS